MVDDYNLSRMQYIINNSFINFPVPNFDNVYLTNSTGGQLNGVTNWSSIFCSDNRYSFPDIFGQ